MAKTLSKKACIEILKEFDTPKNIFLHSRKVHGVVMYILDKLSQKGVVLDKELLSTAALLHDMKKYHEITKQSGLHHAEAEKILLERGYPEIAQVVAHHDWNAVQNGNNTLTEDVLVYADGRVMHDAIATTKERLDDVTKRYSHIPNVVQVNKKVLACRERFENEVLIAHGIQPEDITEQSIAPYLIEDDY